MRRANPAGLETLGQEMYSLNLTTGLSVKYLTCSNRIFKFSPKPAKGKSARLFSPCLRATHWQTKHDFTMLAFCGKRGGEVKDLQLLQDLAQEIGKGENGEIGRGK